MADVANTLNQIMNAKRSGKKECVLPASKLLIEVLKIMKENNYVDYKISEDKSKIIVEIKDINKCKAIKPRFNVKQEKMENYIRRFLPARDIGILIISTSKGLMTQKEAMEKGAGGSLIAYCF